MTQRLYQTDAYLRQFEARVLDVDGQWIEFDQTAFYPPGGGQPGDQGELRRAADLWVVGQLRQQSGRIWHQVDGPPPAIGSVLHAELDWQRRYALMRTHTAMHILCGVIWRDYQASVTGSSMDLLRGRMDFEFETMRAELIGAIEAAINAEVRAARPVQTRILPRAEAFAIPDLIRTKINLLPEGIREVRVVEIVGLDLQADGGTHVANTREVGPLRVVDYKSKGAINKRIVVELIA